MNNVNNDATQHPKSQFNSIFVVGPTASGKSSLALKIAKKYAGEIICADSRTIYKTLDIGTAKPSPEEREEVLHHCLDLVYPDMIFSAAQFKKLAQEKILDIQKRKKLPIIVGGTGLYVDGLLFDYEFGTPADETLRKSLEDCSILELQKIIIEKNIEMPENKLNKRYLVRAIEQGGVNKKRQQQIADDVLVVGLNPHKDRLKKQIEQRTRAMVDAGLVDEAKELFERYGTEAPGASGNAYRLLVPFVEQKQSVQDCMDAIVTADLQLAKKQRTWFMRNKSIHWFESSKDAEQYIDSALTK